MHIPREGLQKTTDPATVNATKVVQPHAY